MEKYHIQLMEIVLYRQLWLPTSTIKETYFYRQPLAADKVQLRKRISFYRQPVADKVECVT